MPINEALVGRASYHLLAPQTYFQPLLAYPRALVPLDGVDAKAAKDGKCLEQCLICRTKCAGGFVYQLRHPYHHLSNHRGRKDREMDNK